MESIEVFPNLRKDQVLYSPVSINERMDIPCCGSFTKIRRLFKMVWEDIVAQCDRRWGWSAKSRLPLGACWRFSKACDLYLIVPFHMIEKLLLKI